MCHECAPPELKARACAQTAPSACARIPVMVGPSASICTLALLNIHAIMPFADPATPRKHASGLLVKQLHSGCPAEVRIWRAPGGRNDYMTVDLITTTPLSAPCTVCGLARPLVNPLRSLSSCSSAILAGRMAMVMMPTSETMCTTKSMAGTVSKRRASETDSEKA